MNVSRNYAAFAGHREMETAAMAPDNQSRVWLIGGALTQFLFKQDP